MADQARHVKKFRIKQGDTVQVIQGKEAGKKGKVLHVLEAEERIVVERVNFIKRHVRPSKKLPQGGVIEREASMHISNVQVGLPQLRPARAGGRAQGRRREGPLLQEVQRPGG